MQNLIEVKNLSIICHPNTEWTPGHLEFARCLGFTFHNNLIYINLEKTDKQSLFRWLRHVYPEMMMTDKWANFREFMLYPELKARYYDIEQMFKNELLYKLPYKDKFWRHQLEALILLTHRKHNLLAFDQGLGKTITSIAVSDLLGFKRTIIVSPALPKWNWFYRLIEDWGYNAVDFRIFDVQRPVNGLTDKYTLINYDIVEKHLKDLLLIAKKQEVHLIFDECQYLKNTSTGRTKAIKKLVEATNNKITFLSGTPIKNKVEDLYSYLQIVGHELGKNKEAFARRFTHKEVDGEKYKWRVRNANELRSKIGNFMIRAHKNDCADIPLKSFRKYYYELNDFRTEYEGALEQLRQDGAAVKGHIHSVNIVASLSKIKGVIELAESIVDSERKVVIFTGYKRPFAALKEHFGDRALYINGETPSKIRADIANEFQNGDKMVFIGQTQAAGVGIDLYESSDVIFCDLPLTASEVAQAMDRVHRIGQTKPVMVNYMIARETIDEALYELIAKKADDANLLIDNNQSDVDFRAAQEDLIKRIFASYKQMKTKAMF